MEDQNYCQQLLQKELASRKAKNSFYSLRAFARDLEIGSTSLSDVLAAKRSLSNRNIQKVADKLSLSPMEVELMRGSEDRVRQKEEVERLQLEEDEFNLIADWYHLGILSLAKIKGCKADPDWVADRLGIELEQAEKAITTLKRLRFIEIKRGKIYRTAVPLSTTRDIPSTAIKRYHHSTLGLAESSLFDDEVDAREFSSMTMAINPDKLPEAKDLLMKTKRKISKMLETGTPKEVYLLSFQLFPLTTLKKTTKIKPETKVQ